jgi:hypothetical protein
MMSREREHEAHLKNLIRVAFFESRDARILSEFSDPGANQSTAAARYFTFNYCGLNCTGALFRATRERQVCLESENIFPAPPLRAGG